MLRRSALTSIALVALTTGCHRSESNPQTVDPSTAVGQSTTASTYAAGPEAGVAEADARYAAVEIAADSRTEATEEIPDLVGYQTLSDGNQVQVVTYVHTYAEPVETYPRVYWAGYWYYNVHGNFVFWSDYYYGWCSYWGPPVGLVYVWNHHYPWIAYSWGVGFYGPGWYWGGVSYIGYHAYGYPPEYYHHHHHSRPVLPGRPDPGGPSGDDGPGPQANAVPDGLGKTSPGSSSTPAQFVPGDRPKPTPSQLAVPPPNTPSSQGGKATFRPVRPSSSTLVAPGGAKKSATKADLGPPAPTKTKLEPSYDPVPPIPAQKRPSKKSTPPASLPAKKSSPTNVRPATRPPKSKPSGSTFRPSPKRSSPPSRSKPTPTRRPTSTPPRRSSPKGLSRPKRSPHSS